jgi:hypothetical protein
MDSTPHIRIHTLVLLARFSGLGVKRSTITTKTTAIRLAIVAIRVPRANPGMSLPLPPHVPSRDDDVGRLLPWFRRRRPFPDSSTSEGRNAVSRRSRRCLPQGNRTGARRAPALSLPQRPGKPSRATRRRSSRLEPQVLRSGRTGRTGWKGGGNSVKFEHESCTRKVLDSPPPLHRKG